MNDSFEIAIYPHAMARNAPLVPSSVFAETRGWTDSAELALYSACLRDTRRIQAGSEALADRALSGRRFVCDAFGFADSVIATAIQAITPVDDRYIP